MSVKMLRTIYADLQALSNLAPDDTAWTEKETAVVVRLGLVTPTGTAIEALGVAVKVVLLAARCGEQLLVGALMAWHRLVIISRATELQPEGAVRGETDAAAALACAGPGALGVVNHRGQTPLFEAAASGCLPAFALLFKDLMARASESELVRRGLLRPSDPVSSN